MSFKLNRQESLPGADGKTFKVGDGAHYGWNGDRYPMTVVKISDSGRDVYCSADEAVIIDNRGGYVEGDRECQFTTITVPDEHLRCFKLRKHGKFSRTPGKRAFDVLYHERRYARNPCI